MNNKNIIFFRCLLIFIILSFLISFVTPSVNSSSTQYSIEYENNLSAPHINNAESLTNNSLKISNDSIKFEDRNITFDKTSNLTLNWSNKSIKITNQTELKHIPENSITTELPDKRVLVKYPNQTSKIYNLSYKDVGNFNGSFEGKINGTSFLISDEEIPSMTEELNKSFKGIKFSTNIKKLDEYKTTLNLTKVIDNQHLYPIVEEFGRINISWGDGTHSILEPNKMEINHIYKKSGKYPISITIKSKNDSIPNITAQNIFLVNDEVPITELPALTIKTYPKETAAAASAGIGTAAVLGFAATETGKYKLFSLLVSLSVPLYTRIKKEDVLDQFVRGQIYAIIKTNPGIHYNKIMEKIDAKNGALSYHLHILEKTDMIKSRKEGLRYRVFYTADTKFPKEERYRLTELQTKIIEVVK